MDRRDAHEEFAKAFNRLCRAQGQARMANMPESGAQFLVHTVEGERRPQPMFTPGGLFDRIGNPAEHTITIKFVVVPEIEAPRPGWGRWQDVDFESTAEEVADPPQLPAEPKQLTKGSDVEDTGSDDRGSDRKSLPKGTV